MPFQQETTQDRFSEQRVEAVTKHRGMFGRWAQETLTLGSAAGEGCLAGDVGACRASLTLGPTYGESQPLLAVPEWIHAELGRHQPVRPAFAGQDKFWMGDLEAEFGTERFARFWTSDQPVDQAFLEAILKDTADDTFNMVTIDGDMSTNDTVMLMANGEAGNKAIQAGTPDAEAFAQAFRALCDYLTKELVRDAEGSSKIFSVRVEGAKSKTDARLAARAVAASSLVKSAIHGNDPNWGRVVAAVGYSGADVLVEKVSFSINDITIMEAGTPIAFHRDAVISIMNNPEVALTVKLGLGDGIAVAWGCELTEEYVQFNSAYTT